METCLEMLLWKQRKMNLSQIPSLLDSPFLQGQMAPLPIGTSCSQRTISQGPSPVRCFYSPKVLCPPLRRLGAKSELSDPAPPGHPSSL